MTEARITGLAWTLGVLAAVSLFVGLYAFIWPHSFYDHVLGVDRLPPYNQHLLSDVGGFYLGFAVLFAWLPWTAAEHSCSPHTQPGSWSRPCTSPTTGPISSTSRR